jgi:hypothetical protein
VVNAWNVAPRDVAALAGPVLYSGWPPKGCTRRVRRASGGRVCCESPFGELPHRRPGPSSTLGGVQEAQGALIGAEASLGDLNRAQALWDRDLGETSPPGPEETPSPSGPPETQGRRVSLSRPGSDLPRDAARGASVQVGRVGGTTPSGVGSFHPGGGYLRGRGPRVRLSSSPRVLLGRRGGRSGSSPRDRLFPPRTCLV